MTMRGTAETVLDIQSTPSNTVVVGMGLKEEENDRMSKRKRTRRLDKHCQHWSRNQEHPLRIDRVLASMAGEATCPSVAFAVVAIRMFLDAVHQSFVRFLDEDGDQLHPYVDHHGVLKIIERYNTHADNVHHYLEVILCFDLRMLLERKFGRNVHRYPLQLLAVRAVVHQSDHRSDRISASVPRMIHHTSLHRF